MSGDIRSPRQAQVGPPHEAGPPGKEVVAWLLVVGVWCDVHTTADQVPAVNPPGPAPGAGLRAHHSRGRAPGERLSGHLSRTASRRGWVSAAPALEWNSSASTGSGLGAGGPPAGAGKSVCRGQFTLTSSDGCSVPAGIKDYSNWPTIPQVYLNGEFVGGCDILLQMHQNGDLVEELRKLGIRSALLDEKQDQDSK